MTAKQFEGEIKIRSRFHGYRIRTEDGDVDLEYQPADVNYGFARAIRRGDYLLVAYLDVDQGTAPPWQYDDGTGRVYTKDGDKSDWRIALDLNGDDDPDYEGRQDDEFELEVVRRSIKHLYENNWRGKVYAIELASNGDGDDHSWNVAVLDENDPVKQDRTYRASTFHLAEDFGGRTHYVTMFGKAEEVQAEGPILQEWWQKARENGDVGEKWAVLLRDRSPSSCQTHWVVAGPWPSVEPKDLYKYTGVWVPNDLASDIEEQPEAERWAKALEFATQAVDTYNEWANGNCYNINMEIFKLINPTGEEGDEKWVQVVDASTMQDHDCAGGVYYGSDDALSVMDEFLTTALDGPLDVLLKEGKLPS